MLIGALLILTWLVLLVRYPLRAVPISLGPCSVWHLSPAGCSGRNIEEQLLSRLEIRLTHDPQRPALSRCMCNWSTTRTGSCRVCNGRWPPIPRAHAPTLARRAYDAPAYQGPGDLQPGVRWESCLPLPLLRSGYRAATLEFHAERLQGHFAH